MSCAPAKSPCGSCPYRRDVPSGIWAEEEYAKLPPYDRETPYQPSEVFFCHQQDGHVCAGWAGTINGPENLALRLAAASDLLDLDDLDAIIDYESPVPLFASGAEAAAHGLSGVEAPDARAVAAIQKLDHRRQRGAR